MRFRRVLAAGSVGEQREIQAAGDQDRSPAGTFPALPHGQNGHLPGQPFMTVDAHAAASLATKSAMLKSTSMIRFIASSFWGLFP